MLTGLAASWRAPYDLLLVPPWSPPPWRQLSRSRPVCLPFASGAVQTPPPAHALRGTTPPSCSRPLKLSRLSLIRSITSVGDDRAKVYLVLLPSEPPISPSTGPQEASARAHAARAKCTRCTAQPTQVPAWQPLAPQCAGPSAGIIPVPQSGRARGAWPLSPLWSLPARHPRRA